MKFGVDSLLHLVLRCLKLLCFLVIIGNGGGFFFFTLIIHTFYANVT